MQQVEVIGVETGAAAIEAIEARPTDCLILTPDPADMTLATLAEQAIARSEADGPPVLLYVDPDEPLDSRQRLMHLANEFNLAIRRRSPDDLIDQAAVALCQPVDTLPEERQRDDSQALPSRRTCWPARRC